MSDAHPYRCPACETTIRATNLEWLYDDGDNGEVVGSSYVAFSEYKYSDTKEQLFFCPNDDCRIERLLPGERDE